jgi:hypothetical protein
MENGPVSTEPGDHKRDAGTSLLTHNRDVGGRSLPQPALPLLAAAAAVTAAAPPRTRRPPPPPTTTVT